MEHSNGFVKVDGSGPGPDHTVFHVDVPDSASAHMTTLPAGKQAPPDMDCVVKQDDVEKNDRNCSVWCRKYFWEGQTLAKGATEGAVDTKNMDWQQKFLKKYRRHIGVLLPVSFVHFFWWAYMIKYDQWHLFPDKYYMSLTMIVGSTFAGMTTVGGGAVAFPVMTLAFSIHPSVARDFSLMVQTSGMNVATFGIFFMGVQIEKNALVFGSIGGFIGILLGFHFIADEVPNNYKKMCFVSIWFSFGIALYLLNRRKDRQAHRVIPNFTMWKAAVLLLTGVLGGIITSMAGTGLDICMFSVITLLFRLSEKTATPTTVVLMAWNSTIGLYWRTVMMSPGVSTEAWEFITVSIEVVVVFAALGSLLGTHFHRLVLASLVYVLVTASLISAFFIVDQYLVLSLVSVGLIIGGGIFFVILTKLGEVVKRADARAEES